MSRFLESAAARNLESGSARAIESGFTGSTLAMSASGTGVFAGSAAIALSTGPASFPMTASGSGQFIGSGALILRLKASGSGSGTFSGSAALLLGGKLPMSGHGTGTSSGRAFFAVSSRLVIIDLSVVVGALRSDPPVDVESFSVPTLVADFGENTMIVHELRSEPPPPVAALDDFGETSVVVHELRDGPPVIVGV